MTINAQANAAVQAAIDQAIAEKGEIGIQVAAYLGVDLGVGCIGSHDDKDSGRKVDGDTLFNVFSVNKAEASTAMQVQVETGLLDYDRTIAAYSSDKRRVGERGVRDC